MKMLVIGSCTGEKSVRDCPDLLTQADFDDLSRLKRREAELAQWALPARDLYTGWQHRYMMSGVMVIRERFGVPACSVKILSAGYGLVGEEQILVPYEATFQKQRSNCIRARAEALGIPSAVSTAILGHDLVIFFLGKEYLQSIGLPIAPEISQRLVFFTSNVQFQFHPDAVIVPAGLNETRFGAGPVALKGKMFERFATGLCSAPAMCERLQCDRSRSTVLALIEAGQSKS
jgi:uncharacterized protein DUF6884